MDSQPDTSELLDNSIADLDETYKKYEAVCTERATHAFLWDSYEYLDAIYKDIVIPLSPAYLSGSDWYVGDDLPLALFELLLIIGLIQNACCYTGCIKKYCITIVDFVIDFTD